MTVITRSSGQQVSDSRQKVMRFYKHLHRPINNVKTVHQTSLLHIESNLDRLGLLSPTHGQRSRVANPDRAAATAGSELLMATSLFSVKTMPKCGVKRERERSDIFVAQAACYLKKI